MIGPLPGRNLKWVLGLIAATFLVAPDPGAVAIADELAYSCERDICLINPDNPAQHSNLTETGLADERAPSWSPDGNVIAVVADYFGSYDVLTIDPTKTAVEQEATAISETPDRGANSGRRPGRPTAPRSPSPNASTPMRRRILKARSTSVPGTGAPTRSRSTRPPTSQS